MTTTEQEVRRAMRQAAESLEPSAWPSAQVRARALRQRRRARATVLVAAVAAAAAIAIPVAATGVLRSESQTMPGGAGGTASASTSWAPPPSARAGTGSATSVQVVVPGRRVQAGHGVWLTLTTTHRCVGGNGSSDCDSAVVGNQESGTVTMRMVGDSTGTLDSPLYIGPGQAARMTISTGAKVYPVTVVSLAGHPGYATGYAWIPTTADPRPATPSTITVYDAANHVLATFSWP
ncbi:hypothetical protein EDD99_5722 [Streptomyces sp. 846.5]|nr:hypothetical protein [Streptomyces sp. 846.5]TDT97572.1 hypothetical protein EDD99_5722 [Streptomyces sp. 846.5]